MILEQKVEELRETLEIIIDECIEDEEVGLLIWMGFKSNVLDEETAKKWSNKNGLNWPYYVD